MATIKQVEANQRNSMRSTGPTSESGKARSRVNATKHGMAGESVQVEAGASAEFVDRRARWAAEQDPVGDAANWALDRAVAASLRIERCEHALDNLVVVTRERAGLAWDQDRELEAATTFGRLARYPLLASRQLEATLAGVRLLIDSWFGLTATLEAGRDWSESEVAKALDLLGVGADLREGWTPLDSPEGSEPIAFRLELALEEIERLESLRDEAMAPLDEAEQRRAMVGDVALLSKPASLILRYERDAWRRYRESMKELKAQAPPPVVGLKPVIVQPPRSPKPPAAPASPTFEEQRRALLAEAAPYRKEVTEGLVSIGLVDEDAWLDALERRMEALADGQSGHPATERSQFAAEVAPAPSMG